MIVRLITYKKIDSILIGMVDTNNFGGFLTKVKTKDPLIINYLFKENDYFPKDTENLNKCKQAKDKATYLLLEQHKKNIQKYPERYI